MPRATSSRVRRRRVAIASGLVAAALLGGLALGPGILARTAERRIAASLGTPVHLGWVWWNPLSGRWRLDGIRIAAERGPAAFVARRAEAQVHLWEVLRGNPRVRMLRLEGARLRLRATPRGWELPLPPAADTSPTTMPHLNLDWIGAPRAVVRLEPRAGVRSVLRMRQLELSAELAPDRLRAAIWTKGRLDRGSLAFSGRLRTRDETHRVQIRLVSERLDLARAVRLAGAEPVQDLRGLGERPRAVRRIGHRNAHRATRRRGPDRRAPGAPRARGGRRLGEGLLGRSVHARPPAAGGHDRSNPAAVCGGLGPEDRLPADDPGGLRRREHRALGATVEPVCRPRRGCGRRRSPHRCDERRADRRRARRYGGARPIRRLGRPRALLGRRGARLGRTGRCDGRGRPSPPGCEGSRRRHRRRAPADRARGGASAAARVGSPLRERCARLEPGCPLRLRRDQSLGPEDGLAGSGATRGRPRLQGDAARRARRTHRSAGRRPELRGHQLALPARRPTPRRDLPVLARAARSRPERPARRDPASDRAAAGPRWPARLPGHDPGALLLARARQPRARCPRRGGPGGARRTPSRPGARRRAVPAPPRGDDRRPEPTLVAEVERLALPPSTRISRARRPIPSGPVR